MSLTTKEMLSRWLPALVALAGFIINAMYIGRWSGQMEGRMTNLEHHAENKDTHIPFERGVQIFVTRAEFNGVKAARDLEISEMKISFRSIDAKLDRLVESVLKKGE
jgi:hypothetical protein